MQPKNLYIYLNIVNISQKTHLRICVYKPYSNASRKLVENIKGVTYFECDITTSNLLLKSKLPVASCFACYAKQQLWNKLRMITCIL